MSDYENSKDFGTKVKGVLRKRKPGPPNLKVKKEKGGIRFYPSRQATAPAPKRIYVFQLRSTFF